MVVASLPDTPVSSEAPRLGGRWTRLVVLAALIAATAAYVVTADDELAQIQRLSLLILLTTSLIQFASQLFWNGSLLLPLKRSAASLGFWELYLVRSGGVLVGSLVPVAGGVAVRLAYLRSRGVSYLEFTSATVLSNLLALGAAAAVAVVATGVLWALTGPPRPAVLGLGVGVLAVSAAAMAAFELVPRLARQPRAARWPWIAALSRLQTTSRRLALDVFSLSVVRHVLNFVTFGLLLQALSGRPNDFLIGGLVYALSSPIRIVNITPGNLGVTEWVVALVGNVVAFDLGTGLIASLAFRGVSLVGQGLGVLLGSGWLAARRRA